MSGGNDFIAKPFLFMELAVKALIYVLRSKLGCPAPATLRQPAAQTPADRSLTFAGFCSVL